MKKHSHLQSKLSVARGHGSAKSGVSHWWLQRVSAVALIPLSLWFVASLLKVAESSDPFALVDWLASPVQALLMVLLSFALFFHARLGFQVVVEDYIKCPCAKYFLLLANNFFAFAAAVVCTLAVLKLHMFHLVSGL